MRFLTTMGGFFLASLFASSVCAAPQPDAAQNCPLPSGWSEIAARKPRFIVFGEIHGTQQSPAFVGDLACALAAREEHLLVAIEHSSTENAAFQKAWRLTDAQFSARLKQAGWAGRTDGVASLAMLDLLIRLHHLAQTGHAVDIVAFNGARNSAQERRFAHLPGQGPHEAAQAENIREAADRRHYDHVLVLVGNLHARKHPIEGHGPSFNPMVMNLAPPAAIVALKMEDAGGTSWNCQLKPGFEKPLPGQALTAEAIDCGSHPLKAATDLQRAPYMALAALPGAAPDPDFDGIVWLGKVSGSAPAVPTG